MDELFQKALAAAQRHGVRNVLVPLGSGTTARKARDVFTADYRVFAVGNEPGVVRFDDGENPGVPPDLAEELESLDICVLVCGQSLFQHIARGTKPLSIAGQDFDFRETWRPFPDLGQVLQQYPENRCLNPISLLLNFCDWFGAGFQVALEIMLLATDTGLLPLDEKVVSIVNPYEPRPACYLVMTPCRTEHVFSRKPEILAIELVQTG